MKDIKPLLKDARDAIKNRDYELALKLSKSILKEDKTNYMALVFLGLALQEVGPVEQASKAFYKAIGYNPNNPLAWNGLIIYYEKQVTDEARIKLFETYISVLDVETNPKKITEYSEKLCKMNDIGDVVKITNSVYKCASKIETNTVNIFEILAKFYQNLKEVPKELQPIFEECFCKLLNLREFKRIEYFASYLNLLYQQNKYEEVFYKAENMHSFFEDNTTSLIWMCKIYNQVFVENLDLTEKLDVKIKEYYPKLLKLEPKNAIGLFTEAIQVFIKNNLLKTKNILREVCHLRPGLVHAWVFLTNIYVLLNLYDEALQAYLSASKLLNSSKYSNVSLKKNLDNLHLKILSNSLNKIDWNQALNIYENTLDEKFKIDNLEHIILVHINLQNITEAQALLTKLNNKNEQKARFLEIKLLEKEKKYNEALNILEKDPPDLSEWWLEIGVIYWLLEDYQKSLIPFLKATKCDPNNYLCLVHLGNYYQKLEDFDKARRCYEKAFQFNRNSQKIATELNKMYCKLKNWEAAQNLLQSITVDAINNKNAWAWLQLGLNYLEQEDYSKAIEKLQFVVRIEKENTYCWQCLADAYFARGSYTSALKCYEKSLKYTENKLYPSLQIANIKKTLGLYEEARIEFTDIILNNEKYSPALKGLAETCLCQAKECYKIQRLGAARNHAQSALKYITDAMDQKNNFSCLWKFTADVCLFVTNLPEKYCWLLVTQKLVKEKTKIKQEEMFNLATSCYCKAISLIEDNILIWHDLSSCYLKHALHTKDQERKNLLLSYAIAAGKHCINSNPKNWQHWNLLGNVEMEKTPSNFALAQHYFIKAVTVENNNPISWSNLGVLYLVMGDVKLANKSFAQGQRSDPNYINNWIGQALIAESMGVEDAMDLFRHSVQLGHHQQGAIGYGHWVCQTVLKPSQNTSYSIEGMHAIPVACDALTWYTEKNYEDGCAWNMLGMLKERLKLNLGSLEAFKKAYEISQNMRDFARINYGRLLSKHENYNEATNIFQEVEKALFSSGSGLALALFKSQHYEESYDAYNQALHWLTEEQSHQSELLVALASMAYMFQGLEGAKTLLFQSIHLKPPSPWGLYATLALGLIHEDFQLSELVLNELKHLKDNQDCLPHYAILLCSKLLKEKNPDKAVKELSKLVHRHPNNASVWLTLAITILRVKSERKRALAAVKCANVALKIGQSSMDVTNILGYISLGYLLNGNVKNVLISAQKAIHCYPNLANGWALLLAALVKDKEHYSKDFISKTFDYVTNLNSTELLVNWLNKLKKKL